MYIIGERIRRDIKAVYARRPTAIRLAHRALDSATVVAINTAALLSPLTNRLPRRTQESLHGRVIFLLKEAGIARADYGGERDPPSLDALRRAVLDLRVTTEEKECPACDGDVCEAHAQLAYHWYLFAENAAVLQFSLIYFDRVNSVWEAFRARWGRKFLINSADGKILVSKGSLTDSISEVARDGVYLAACASDMFLSEYRWLAERDPKSRDLLEELKRRYEAPLLVATWASVLPGGFIEKVCGFDN